MEPLTSSNYQQEDTNLIDGQHRWPIWSKKSIQSCRALLEEAV